MIVSFASLPNPRPVAALGRRRPTRALLVPKLSVLVCVIGCSFPDYRFEGQVNDGTLGSTSAGGSSFSGGTSGLGGTESSTFGGFGGTDVGGAGGSPSGAGGTESSGGTDATDSTSSATDGGGTTGTATSTNGGIGGSEGGSAGTDGAGGSGGSGGSTATGGSSAGGTGGTLGEGECGNDLQCNSGQCDDGWCRPAHCGNGVVDPYETDTDCGGPECRACGYDQMCQRDDDCASAQCGAQDKCTSSLVVLCACGLDGTCTSNPTSTPVVLQLRNDGTQRITLSDFTYHYFYSSESQFGRDQVSCTAMNFSGGTCSVFMGQSLETDYEEPSASREIEFRLSAGSVDPGTMTGALQFAIEGNGPYQRDNDYSYQGVPTDNSFAVCEHVVVKGEDGVPVWGRLPE